MSRRSRRTHMKKSAILLALTVLILAGLFPQSVLAEDAAALYKAKMCAACHGPDGNGKTPLNTPDVQKATDAQLAQTIADGKPPKMPAFKSKLNDDQVKALVTYIRTFKK